MTIPVAPQGTISAEQLAAIVELACRAPSLHNSQPWRWTFEDHMLHLFADHARVGHHTDITGQEVILSCGAALHHVQVAAAAAGWRAEVNRYPDPRDRDHLASIAFQRDDSRKDHDRELGEAISRRRTDRLAFAAPEPWTQFEAHLREILDGTAVAIDVIGADQRPALAAASQRSEAHRRGDASYRYELLWWSGQSHVGDGLPSGVLPSTAEASRVDVARDFPVYGAGDRRPEVESDHSNVLVLSTFDDSPDNMLRCGEALSRVLLECTAAGFATCTLTHMIEVHASREMVRTITGRRAEPQALIRVGSVSDMTPPAVRTPRRPIGDVLQIR